MLEMIGAWIDKPIKVTLRLGGLATAITLEGTLLKVDDTGVLIQAAKGQCFVPTSAILHIVLSEA